MEMTVLRRRCHGSRILRVARLKCLSMINRVMRDPQIVRDRLNPLGVSPIGTTPGLFQEVTKAGLVKYARITKDAGIRPQ